MRKVLPLSGGFLFLTVLCWPGRVHAQEAKPFEDVKPDHWAYQTANDLHAKGVISGYPDGHFSGQRTLTRYEFAVALKRALDGMPGMQKPHKTDPARSELHTKPSEAGSAPLLLTRIEIEELQRLTLLFKEELTSLGMDTKEALASLIKLSATADSAKRADRIVPPIGASLIGTSTSKERSGFGAFGSGALISSPRTPGNLSPSYNQDGFGIRAKIGGATATLFSASTGNSAGFLFPGSGLSGDENIASPLRRPASGVFGAQQFYGSRGANYGSAYSQDYLNAGSAAPGRVFGLQGDLPLSKNSAIGLSFLDFSTDKPGVTGNGSSLLSAPLSDISVYGANLRLSSGGRFAFSGEASKSVAQRRLSDDTNNDDNNAYLLNLNYNGGPITGAAGYQYYDPSFAGPGYLNSLGTGYSPVNVQGPFARLGGRVDRFQADLGVDYLTGARNRPGFGGFTQGSSVLRGQAGLGYHFSKQFEITANYEGVLYDMSGAVSASGMRAKPVEQYLTLGAGLNLSGSTVLRMAYQIINVQDAGNGFGLAPIGGSASGAAASTSVFTTQFSVHF